MAYRHVGTLPAVDDCPEPIEHLGAGPKSRCVLGGTIRGILPADVLVRCGDNLGFWARFRGFRIASLLACPECRRLCLLHGFGHAAALTRKNRAVLGSSDPDDATQFFSSPRCPSARADQMLARGGGSARRLLRAAAIRAGLRAYLPVVPRAYKQVCAWGTFGPRRNEHLDATIPVSVQL
jgi:hypothetical protein